MPCLFYRRLSWKRRSRVSLCTRLTVAQLLAPSCSPEALSMQLGWRTNLNLCCLHAADQARRGRSSDGSLAALPEPVGRLQAALKDERLPEERFWELIVPASAEFDHPRALAEVVLIKLQGRTEATIRVPRFARLLTELYGAFRQAQPKLGESLQGLVQPMQQRWNEGGPGILARIPPWTDADVLVEEATIFVMPSLCGGGGGAHLAAN